MLRAQLNAFGEPSSVVTCIDAEEPGAPGPDEVLVEMLACPINPAELLLIQGRYASRPALPAPLGIEGAGRVLALGADVDDLAVGDLVMSLSRSNWVQRCLLPRAQLVRLPADIDGRQAAMLKVNPATALLMLETYVELAPGDWVIQNAANSGVGTALIALARALGVRTVNVVRREAAAEALRRRLPSGHRVVVDGDDLPRRVRAAIGADRRTESGAGADSDSDGGALALAIDAVAGRSTWRLAACLDDGGTVVNYGLLSGEPCQLGADQAIFHGISLTGFWLAKTLQQKTPAQTEALYARLAPLLIDGRLRVAVEACYPLDRIDEALGHALREHRDGKILLLPNG